MVAERGFDVAHETLIEHEQMKSLNERVKHLR